MKLRSQAPAQSVKAPAPTPSLLSELIKTVPWMLESPASVTWRLLNDHTGGFLEFSFNQALSEHFSLIDPSHETWRVSMVESIVRYASRRGYGEFGGGTIYYLCLSFVTLFKWLVSNGIDIRSINQGVADDYAKFIATHGDASLLGSLDDDDEEEEEEEEEEDTETSQAKDSGKKTTSRKRLTATTLLRYLMPLRLLWEARSLLPFSMIENPLPSGGHVLATKYGIAGQPSKLISIELGASLLKVSVDFLIQFGDLIADAYLTPSDERAPLLRKLNQQLQDFGYKLEISNKLPKSPGAIPHIALFEVIETFLPHCFFVLVASFTLARPGEVSTLPENCIGGKEESGYWVARYIEKNYKQTRGFPVHPYIQKAVELFERIFGDRREELRTSLLFPKRPGNLGQKSVRHKTFDSPGLRALIDVAKGHEMLSLVLKDSTETVTPRQLRRFCANLWVHRWGLPVAGLSMAMFHFNVATTSYYLANGDFLAATTRARRKKTLEMLEGIAAGAEGFAGQQTKRLQRLIARLRSSVQTTSPQELYNVVVNHLTRELDVVAKECAWGFCLCPRGETNKRRAACFIEGVYKADADGRPDSTASGAGICCGCRFFCSERSRTPYLEEELTRAERVAASEVTPQAQRDLAKRRVIHIKTVVEDLEEAVA